MSSPAYLLSHSFEPTTEDIELKAAQSAKFIKELWLLLTAVVGFLTIINWSTRLFVFLYSPKRAALPEVPASPPEKVSPEASEPGRTGKVSLRRLPHAIASSFRNLAFRTTIPIGPSSVMSVTEVVFIVGYMLALLIWLFVSSEDLDTFFFEDRAATLASCQIPLIVALAGKNNVISFLTGVSHEKLNILHRASARSCLILLWIHALIHAVSGLPEKFDLANGWMRCGVAGLAAFTLATILSIRPIRIMFFEFFLIAHILLVATFLVCGFIHARSRELGAYIWPAFLVWGLDRSMRLGRLIWNNRIWSRKLHEEHHASIELLAHDTVRLTLRRKIHWSAGQHAYVILPSISSIPTEAHPFTIASIPHALDGTEGGEEKDVVFIIRGQNGFTKRLRDHASKKGAKSVPAFLDGPYGCAPDLKRFSTCILVAGGSGVSYTLPLLMDIVHHARKGDSLCERVLFVWVVRQPEHLEWISKLLSQALLSAPSSLLIEPRIFVTGKKLQTNDVLPDYSLFESPSPLSSPSPSSDEGKMSVMLALSSLRTRQGRPDVQRLIRSAVSASTGSVSVDVAGPSALASAVRSTLTSEITSPMAVMKGNPTVTLHVETFGMVKG